MITPATRITTTPWKVIPQSDQGAVTCVVGLTMDPKTITVNSGRDVCSNRVKLPVSAGQVDTTARVVIAVPATPLYKSGTVLNYQCALTGLSSGPDTNGRRQPLGEKVPAASLQVSPVPIPIRVHSPGSRAREIDMRGAWTMGREPDAETPVKEKQP